MLTVMWLLGSGELKHFTAAVPVVGPGNKRRHLWTVLPILLNGSFGSSSRNFAVLVSDSENGLSLLIRGRENALSTPSSSSRLSRVATRMTLPLSTCMISGCCLLCCSALSGRPCTPDLLRWLDLSVRRHHRPLPRGSGRQSPGRGTVTHRARWWADR
jgi:hypothetical protein